MSNIPEPKYMRSQKKIGKLYEVALKELYQMLMSALALNGAGDIKVVNQAKLIIQVEQRIAQLQGDVKGEVIKGLREAFTQGQLDYLLAIHEADSLEDAMQKAGFNQLQMDRIEAIFSDTFKDLLIATNNTSVNIKKVIRQTTSKLMQYEIAVHNSKHQMQKLLFDQLSKQGLSKTINDEGFIGVVDRAGRKWNLKTYSDMVVNTKLQQAHIEGTTSKAQEYGMDLAIVSKHGATDPCREFEGMVISLTGQTKGFPTYRELKATKKIFHPNCQHNVTPIRNYEKLHVKTKEQHQKLMADYELNKKQK